MSELTPDGRRHEPIAQDDTVNQAILENANAVLLRTTREELKTLRDAFNFVLRENEQLHTECAKLRNTAGQEAEEPPSAESESTQSVSLEAESRLGQRDPDFQALSEGVQALEAKLSGMIAAQPEGAQAGTSGIPFSRRPLSEQERILEKVSELIAPWVFPRPNRAQTRLVRDALRGRWLSPGTASRR